MTKSNICFIVSQIWIVGCITSNKKQVFLVFMGIVWTILSVVYGVIE